MLEKRKRFVICKVCGNVYECAYYTQFKCVRFLECEQLPGNLILMRQALRLLRGRGGVRLTRTDTGGIMELTEHEKQHRTRENHHSAYLTDKTVPLSEMLEQLHAAPMHKINLHLDEVEKVECN